MTAATAGPSGQDLFSTFTRDVDSLSRARRETFVLSLLGQATILGLFIYFAGSIIRKEPLPVPPISALEQLPLVFTGQSGGGGGNLEPSPASHGNPPRMSLEQQIVPPTVRVPTAMPELPVPETIVAPPDIHFSQGGQIGDPMSRSGILSDGPGGPVGIGNSCCDGIGDSAGPNVGNGPPGILTPGRGGVSVPQVIFNPEPSFSDEARKAKQQGAVTLMLVVGKDGRPYGIRVAQSLGMGLDEKAIEAVSRWRFRPATLNGQPVATRIAVEVDFHLY